RGFDICVHMIAWLPGETAADALRTAAVIAASGATGIKIHHLHILRGTPLAVEHARAPLRLPTMEEHARLAADILERLPWHITVQRLAGYATAEWVIAPMWTTRAGAIPQMVAKILRARQRRQGDFACPELRLPSAG
ncbi:MAG: TIGR01212 family radical SAM protein, partial [Planctomycetota bacterium]|nr:TIGR01212 family radical SAM protein [Planctomycetota bacterium]